MSRGKIFLLTALLLIVFVTWVKSVEKLSTATKKGAIFITTSAPISTRDTKENKVSTKKPDKLISTEPSTTIVESLNATVVTCGTNDTDDDCSTTFATENRSGNAGAKAPSDNNKTTTETNKKTARKTSINDDEHICACNLQRLFCDINCCCDPDCSPEDKKAFGHCETDENRHYDTKYCNYIRHIYVNNTPFDWEVNQDGLFCVVSSNLPESYVVQKKDPLDSYEAAELEKFGKVSWNDGEEVFEGGLEFSTDDYYGFDDAIWIVRNDSSIDKFRLPTNFLTRPCIFDEDLFYLRNTKNACSQTATGDGNRKLNFSSYFQNMKVVALPKLLNVTKFKNGIFQNCPKNVCLEIEPKLCDNIDLTNCTGIDNTSDIKFRCAYDITKNLNRCRNGVKSLQYNFFHDGSNGIVRVEVLGALQDFAYRFGNDNFELVQEFSAEFFWTGQTKNYSTISSGNPGYIAGKPILIGAKTTGVNATAVRRNSSFFLDNFLALPKNSDGECARNGSHNTPVEFGYDMITQCQLEAKISVKNNSNASQVCVDIQERIFDMWGIPRGQNESLTVGLFGNADPSNVNDWTEILYGTNPKRFLNGTRGDFANKNATLLCRNIAAVLTVEVFHSRIDFKSTLNQEKILGVTFTFAHAQNVTFPVEKIGSGVGVVASLRLGGRVAFFDVTAEKGTTFVDPPRFDVRLPYDFFYPFVKVDSGADLARPNIVGTLFLGCTLLLH